VIVWVALIGWAAAAEDPARVAAQAEAQLEAETYPQDYAAQVAWARASQAAGQPSVALAAWATAAMLSGGNLETTLGPIPALVALGHFDQARAASDAGLALAPELAGAWMLDGWATRYRPWMPSFALHRARRSYRRATELSPENAAAWCGLGWTRLGLGDVRGSKAALETALAHGDSEACATQGLAALPARWTVDATLVGGGSDWVSHPWRDSGTGYTAQVAGAYDSMFGLDVTVRKLHINEVPTTEDLDAEDDDGGDGTDEEPTGEGSPPPPADEPLAPDPTELDAAPAGGDLDQVELWVRAHGGHAGFGAQAVFGSLTTSGRADSGLRVLGGRAWATHGVTWTAEFATTAYEDGAEQSQFGAGFWLPVWQDLRVEGGALYSQVGGELPDESLGGSGVAGWAAVAWQGPERPLSARVVSHFGTERRPVRLDEPSVWNVDDTLRLSTQLVMGWAPVSWFSVMGGAEWAQFDTFFPPDVDPEAEGFTDTSQVWMFFGGLTVRPVGHRKRGEGR
jgi:hypothetical protein